MVPCQPCVHAPHCKPVLLAWVPVTKILSVVLSGRTFFLENDEALLHSFAGELAVLCTADVLCDANVSGWAAWIVNPARADFCTQDSAASVLDAIFANRTRCNELLHALDKAFGRLRNHCHVEACVDGVLDGRPALMAFLMASFEEIPVTSPGE